MNKLKFIPVLLLALSFVFTSCGDDDPVVENNKNIVELAQENGFNSLAQALTRADLLTTLSGTTEFTVFAPTDQAFSALLDAIGQNSIDDVPVSVLETILLYHVVPGSIKSTDLSNSNVASVEGSSLAINIDNGVTVNGVSVVNPFDVEASNGVIHTIGEVLVPESVLAFVNTVLEPAYFNKDFSTLVSAVVKADLVDALLTTPNLTIFAPNNDAFTNAGIDPNAIDVATLTSVLTYHVVGAKVLSTEIPREAATLNTNEIIFSLTPNGNFINGNTEIIAVDIESGSGVVHVIDNVLLPPSGNLVETAIELSGSGEFTSLIAALTRTATEGTPDQNLITVLAGDGPFTVFAPTNAAFQAVLDSNMDWNTLDDIPLETLIAVLTYHVVPALAFDVDLNGALDSNGQLPTALGQNIQIDLNTLTINGNSSIVGTNTLATNGVIHVIDAVLLP